MTALIQLGKPGKIGNRPGVRNPMVAAIRAFQPRQPVKHEHVVYGPKGASRLWRKYGIEPGGEAPRPLEAGE